MKHNTKHTASAASARKRMIALRPDATEMAEIEQMAEQQMRSIAQMALVCMRLGMQEIQASNGQDK